TLDPVQGLPALRRDWILNRGDVEPCEGREVKPIDDGWLSEKHAAARNGSSKSQTPNPKFKREILRAKNSAVTQLAYARRGIITPEMEFIAVRENLGRAMERTEDRGQRTEGNNGEHASHVTRHSSLARNDL